MSGRSQHPTTQELELRLAEAQATIEALLSDRVDAVVDPISSTPLLLFKAQAALRESESSLLAERDRAQRFLDTASVMLVALDSQGIITLANRYACRLLGWDANELIGLSWIDTCMPERIRERMRTQFQTLLEGEIGIIENEVVTRTGEERLIEWYNTVVRDEEGRAIGSFSSGADITERTLALNALRIGEERTRFALESANVGIWDADYTTGAVEWSPVLHAQYGLPPGSFAGTFGALIQRVHPDDQAAVRTTISEAVAVGDDFSVQHRIVRPDGTVRWLNGTGHVVHGPDGKAVRALGISQDVTEQHLQGLQVQQAQRMEAIGHLASGVAHDFNNMLSVILGWSMQALDDLPPVHPVREALDEVIRAAQSGASLTKQLLLFSRQEIASTVLFNPNDLVVEMDRMLQRLIGESITLVTRPAEDVGNVRMDRGQLEHVLMNLVVNARDAMPDGGKLTIETANVVLDREFVHGAKLAPGEYVMLSVTDSGTGISEEVRARMFEPFFSTKRREKGTGLGLATCHGVIRQAGGAIAVYSEMGIGTAMKLYLPRSREPEAVRTSGLNEVMRGNETILLVEDEAAVRRVTVRVLERLGYRVLSCANGEDAARMLASSPDPIHLLMTDVVLGPGMSGRVLVDRIAQLRPKLPVLFISGYTSDVALLNGILEGNVQFLQKPFTVTSLGQKVREVLSAG